MISVIVCLFAAMIKTDILKTFLNSPALYGFSNSSRKPLTVSDKNDILILTVGSYPYVSTTLGKAFPSLL